MRVIFTRKTKEDFKKHNDYVRKQKKSDGHNYQPYELKGINKSFRKNLKENLENIKEPKDSIFPKEFEYNSDNHKMYVDKKSHYVVFYKVIKPKKGNPYISVEKNIHSTELKKELDKKGIKPIKDCDKTLLDDLETVYKEDEINLRDDSEDNEEKEEEVTDPNTGKKIKKVKYTGPRGGHYYLDNDKDKVYPPELNESQKSLKSVLLESIKEFKIKPLSDYLKDKLIG